MSVFLQPIYTQTVGAGGAANVIFNNIPQGYTDLRVVISARSLQGSAWDDMFMYFNNSADRLYSYLIGYGLPTINTFAGEDVGNKGWAGWANGNTTTANSFCNNVVYINNYSGGEWKSWSTDTVVASPADSAVPMGFLGGCWRNNAPITTLTFANATGNPFMQGTTFTLYGISDVYDTTAPAAPTIGTVTDLAGVAGVNFTANDSGQGRTADNYSVFDQTIMSAPVYSSQSPVAVPVAVNSTYNNLAVSANNAIGSGVSANPAGFTSYNNYASIATATVGAGGVGSITFSNIPQYYQHLQIRGISRSTVSQSGSLIFIVFNNDVGANYSFHLLNADGASVFGTGAANQTAINFRDTTAASNTANSFGASVFDILDYANTSKTKTVKSVAGYDNNGSGFLGLGSGAWNSVTPITSITINLYASIAQNSQFALYGIG